MQWADNPDKEYCHIPALQQAYRDNHIILLLFSEAAVKGWFALQHCTKLIHLNSKNIMNKWNSTHGILCTSESEAGKVIVLNTEVYDWSHNNTDKNQ